MIELYEILQHWDTDDGITYHDPTDDDTWYNFATGIYHPTAKIPRDELYHEGRTKEESSNHIGSGRYPKGSGKDPFQHNKEQNTRYAETADHRGVEKIKSERDRQMRIELVKQRQKYKAECRVYD